MLRRYYKRESDSSDEPAALELLLSYGDDYFVIAFLADLLFYLGKQPEKATLGCPAWKVALTNRTFYRSYKQMLVVHAFPLLDALRADVARVYREWRPRFSTLLTSVPFIHYLNDSLIGRFRLTVNDNGCTIAPLLSPKVFFDWLTSDRSSLAQSSGWYGALVDRIKILLHTRPDDTPKVDFWEDVDPMPLEDTDDYAINLLFFGLVTGYNVDRWKEAASFAIYYNKSSNNNAKVIIFRFDDYWKMSFTFRHIK